MLNNFKLHILSEWKFDPNILKGAFQSLFPTFKMGGSAREMIFRKLKCRMPTLNKFEDIFISKKLN